MTEIKGLSSDPAEAYEQGRRDGAAEVLHAAEVAEASQGIEKNRLRTEWETITMHKCINEVFDPDYVNWLEERILSRKKCIAGKAREVIAFINEVFDPDYVNWLKERTLTRKIK